jgi:hypothetical protein
MLDYYRHLSPNISENMTSFSNLFENATAVINDDALFGSSDPTTDEPEISMLAQQRITLVITAIPCIVILAICAICCFCPRITNNLDTCISINGGRNDDEYIDAIARRQMEEEEKNRENPVERRKRLENHVSSNNVTMVSEYQYRNLKHLRCGAYPRILLQYSYSFAFLLFVDCDEGMFPVQWSKSVRYRRFR